MRYLLKILLLFCIFFAHFTYAAPGVVVVVGGGPEGEIGEKTAWSYPLYKKLIENGSIHGDGKIKVVVLSLAQPETNFMVDYLKSMGATSSENVIVDSRKKANDPKIVDTVASADIIFFRGGNQAEAYRFWRGTRLHRHINRVAAIGGAIGGTSSGAMSLSQHTFSGGRDLVTLDVLSNAHSELLDDEMGGSGIHKDFLNFVPGAIVDTHCGERGRIGRLLGVQAKAIEDSGDKKILGICLEERTGIAITKNMAEVFGIGAAHFFQSTADSILIRRPEKPLIYTSVRDDALTEGWHYDLKKREPDLRKLPKDTAKIFNKNNCGFLSFIDDAYSELSAPSGDPLKGIIQARAINKIYDQPNTSVIMTAREILAKTIEAHTEVTFLNRTKTSGQSVATLIMDCKYCSHKSRSSFISNQDDGSNTLHSAGLVNMRLHVVDNNWSYDYKIHEVKPHSEKLPALTDGNNCNEIIAPSFSIEKKFLKLINSIKENLECR